MSPGTSLVITSIYTKLFVTVYPKQDAETVILLHGGPGVPMPFSSLAKFLAQKYQVITFDQRGTARSPADAHASFSMDEYVADIDTIARHFNLKSFHLFGHSWGGLYAQIYAEQRPEKIQSMFLVSPGSGTGAQWKQVEREVFAFNTRHTNWYEWMRMGLMSFLGALGSDRAYQILFKQVLTNYYRDFDPAFHATDTMVAFVRARPTDATRKQIVAYHPLAPMAHTPFPVCVMYGEKDIYTESKRYVRERFPHAQFIEIPRAGHLPWKQNSEAFYEILKKFYAMA